MTDPRSNGAAAVQGRGTAGRVTRFIALNLATWAAIAFVFAIQASSRSSWRQPFDSALGHTLLGFSPYALLTPVVALIALRYRFLPGKRGSSVMVHAGALVAFVFVAGALMGFVEWLPSGPRDEQTPGHAAWNAIFQYMGFHAVIYGLIASAFLVWAYSRQWQERSVAAAQLQAELAEARLHAVTSQIQPHFLFNTLNAIAALIREEPAKAERLVMRLSDLLRQALRNTEQSEVPLENELAFVEKYAEVQETRFGPRLHVTFDVGADVLDAKVPPLILQPIVENAFRHGVGPRAGAGSILVSARRDGERLRLQVSDDGSGVPAQVTDGVGLRTTRARLRQLYGEDFQFVLARIPEGGTLCSIVLPLRENGNGA